MKKFQSKNRIVFADGSSTKMLSVKKKKQIELLKDNYNINYISLLNNNKTFNLSKESQEFLFLKKFL